MKTVVEFRHFATREPIRNWSHVEMTVIPRDNDMLKLQVSKAEGFGQQEEQAYRVQRVQHVLTHTGLGTRHAVLVYVAPIDYWTE